MPQDIKDMEEATKLFSGKTVKRIIADRYAVAIIFTDGTIFGTETFGDANASLRLEQSNVKDITAEQRKTLSDLNKKK